MNISKYQAFALLVQTEYYFDKKLFIYYLGICFQKEFALFLTKLIAFGIFE